MDKGKEGRPVLQHRLDFLERYWLQLGEKRVSTKNMFKCIWTKLPSPALSVWFPPECFLQCVVSLWQRMLSSLEGEGFSIICWRSRRVRSACVVVTWPRCCREGIFTSHISSPAGLPSPAYLRILSELVKPLDLLVPVGVTSSLPVSGQCHPQQHLMSSPDAPSIQGPKSSASRCLMTRWTGVRTGHSIIQSSTLTL